MPLKPEGLRVSPGSPAPLTLTTLAFLLITFTPGIMSVFYLILFPASFSDKHPGHNNMAWESNILFGTLSNNKGATIYKT